MNQEHRRLPNQLASGGRIFQQVQISPEDLERCNSIAADECPRRYCWWWISLSFEWSMRPAEGCTWLACEKPEHWRFKETPCCRCDQESTIDQFEPRGPHIEEDGIDASRWLEARRKNHEEFP